MGEDGVSQYRIHRLNGRSAHFVYMPKVDRSPWQERLAMVERSPTRRFAMFTLLISPHDVLALVCLVAILLGLARLAYGGAVQ